ncbi:hypothetical protein [Halococcus saccharolyticus]|uniref:Uncharacterized protein n=1 Tax=Halococcus saccharolyticus DSM 5350 TaxID=1227455 RepID=M0MAA2_9EURY|nr:hypothetical protein [Halococcus saccharolyticus]EMA42676.1 hypothetical protein C449_16078 [Halococcus saccharolyticus DSM 5350]
MSSQQSGYETMPATEDEDLLHASQSAQFNVVAQAIRFPGDLDEEQRTRVQQHFDSGGFEPEPIQVTARNRQNQALRVRSEWDGVQLHLDVCPTQAPRLAFRPAVAAMGRYYSDHRVKLAALVLVAVAMIAAFALAIMGVV